ncbi:hypothetical protein Pcinc_029215 [Petrolisthes cinctipes]|uniref:Ionotropic glutamate receptor C-terminal domain-containing protein n=1 Tax=Petrolisthes cinctipes TaxID=88211 RepID=A0AAE1F1D8_PETCI|nr:hypothetical protein Pcinc_029215 [Petrolisthes cinctipes]
MDALNIIANKFNFRVKLIHGTDDGKWGSLENGSWVGLLRELQHFGKHLVINSMILNLDTLHSFDYTYPYTISSYGFMIRVPPPVPQWRNILYPFSTLIWCLLLATSLTLAAILTFLIQLLNGVSDPLGFSLKVLGGLVAQAMNTQEIKSWWWAKLWLVVWWLSVDILAAAYTSNLVAVLTVPTFPKVFQTVQELATDDGIKIAMLDYGSAIPMFLRTSQNPTMAALGDKLNMIPITNLFHLYEDIMANEMKKGGYALIVFGDYIDFLRQKYNIMKVTYVMKERIYWSSLSWFLRRHTPYTSTLSEALMHLQETGVLDNLYRIHMGRIFNPDTQVRGDGVLNLNHLQGAFILLGIGLVLASVSQMVERLYPPPPPPSSPQSPSTSLPSLPTIHSTNNTQF